MCFAADNKTERQAKELALRRQRLMEFVTSQIAGSRLGSKDMQVAVQVLNPSHSESSLENEALLPNDSIF